MSSFITVRFLPGKEPGKLCAKSGSYSMAMTWSKFFKSEAVRVPRPGPISTHVSVLGLSAARVEVFALAGLENLLAARSAM